MSAAELLSMPVGTSLQSTFHQQVAVVAGRYGDYVWILLDDGTGFTTGPDDEAVAELAGYLTFVPPSSKERSAAKRPQRPRATAR